MSSARRLSGGAFLLFVVLLVTAGPMQRSAGASHTVPVTVTLTRVTNLGDEGIEDNLRGEADMYAGVEIDGVMLTSFDIHPHDDDTLEPFWTFSRNVSSGTETIPISIEIWDHDECDTPFCSDTGVFESDDDKGDVDPGGDDEVNLVLNLNDGTWSGDVDAPARCSQGEDGNDSRVRVCWDISILSLSGDADADGLLDSWETGGVDFDGDGTIDLPLDTWGADPNHKDLFLEMDFTAGNGPDAGAIAAMKAAFAAAPVNAGGTNNPDGLPGINLWVDTNGLNGGDDFDGGGTIPAADGLDAACNLDSEWYASKGANFNQNRKWVFRYATGSALPSGCTGSGGWGEIGGNDFMDFNHDGGTIMHELGHNLNLRHGGNVDSNCKPNYVSVMNYDNQFNIRQVDGTDIIDYSPPRFAGGRGAAPIGNLTENALNEGNILDATDSTNQMVFTNPAGMKVRARLDQPVDWNGDGDTADNNVTVNIDTNATGGGPSACANGANNSTLGGHDDWTVISIPFRQFGDSADGAINQVTEPEITLDELLQLEELLNTTDVEITKSAPATAVAGTSFLYTFSVTNNGPNPAAPVTVTDVLPAGLTFQSATADCAEAGGTVTCDLGNIPANETVNFAIQVLVSDSLVSANGGPVGITNTATVAFEGTDSDTTNDSDDASTTVNDVADLKVTKVCEPADVVQAGQDWVCTIYVDNLGPSDARSVSIRDEVTSSGVLVMGTSTLDPNRTDSGPFPVASPPNGTTVEFDLNEPLEPQSIVNNGRWVIVVRYSGAESQDVHNKVDVFSRSNTTPDPDMTNNSSSDDVTIAGVADLSVDKTVSPSPVFAGHNLTYTLTVANAGPSTAIAVRVEDVLPGSLEIVSVSASVGSCVAGIPGNPLAPTACDLGNIAAGADEVVTIVAKVPAGVAPGTVLINNASVSGAGNDPDTSDNSDSAAVAVSDDGNLSLEKFASGTPIAGAPYAYEYHVRNLGPSTARNVTMTDVLPPELVFTSAYVNANGPGGLALACNLAVQTNVLTCPLGDIPPSGPEPIKIYVNVVVKASTPHGTLIVNSASLSSDTGDSNPANNEASLSLGSGTRADLAIVKTSDADIYKPSTTIKYTITVTNNGPSDAQAVVVTDNLPVTKQAIYQFDTGGCTKSGLTLTCSFGTIAAGASNSINVYVLVKGNKGQVENTASVVSGQFDPLMANNTSTLIVLIKGGK